MRWVSSVIGDVLLSIAQQLEGPVIYEHTIIGNDRQFCAIR